MEKEQAKVIEVQGITPIDMGSGEDQFFRYVVGLADDTDTKENIKNPPGLVLMDSLGHALVIPVGDWPLVLTAIQKVLEA